MILVKDLKSITAFLYNSLNWIHYIMILHANLMRHILTITMTYRYVSIMRSYVKFATLK